MSKNTHEIIKTLTLVTHIGFTMLTAIFLCMGIGYLIDTYCGTKLMVWFVILGVVSGFRSVYIIIREYLRENSGDS